MAEPTCDCFQPAVFGHGACPLGPKWLEEAEKRKAEREARHRRLVEQARRSAMEASHA